MSMTHEQEQIWFQPCFRPCQRLQELMEINEEDQVIILMDRHVWKGEHWSHLVCNDLEALHRFVKKIGGKRAWFQDKPLRPHYDLKIGSIRNKALELVPLTTTRGLIQFQMDFFTKTQ